MSLYHRVFENLFPPTPFLLSPRKKTSWTARPTPRARLPLPPQTTPPPSPRMRTATGLCACAVGRGRRRAGELSRRRRCRRHGLRGEAAVGGGRSAAPGWAPRGWREPWSSSTGWRGPCAAPARWSCRTVGEGWRGGGPAVRPGAAAASPARPALAWPGHPGRRGWAGPRAVAWLPPPRWGDSGNGNRLPSPFRLPGAFFLFVTVITTAATASPASSFPRCLAAGGRRCLSQGGGCPCPLLPPLCPGEQVVWGAEPSLSGFI